MELVIESSVTADDSASGSVLFRLAELPCVPDSELIERSWLDGSENSGRTTTADEFVCPRPMPQAAIISKSVKGSSFISLQIGATDSGTVQSCFERNT